MAVIGELAVRMTTKNKKFNRGLRDSQHALTKFRGSVMTTIKRVGAFGAAIAAAAGVGGLGMMIKSSMQTIDALAKTSKKLGIATDALVGLRLAAEETGAGTKTLDMGLQRMIRRIAEAAQGTGEAKAALIELGLSARALSMLAPDQQFMAIAEAMEKVKSESDKVRLSFKLFDAEGVALKNTLALGKKGLEETAQAARDLGAALSEADIKSIEEANDAVGRLKLMLQGVGNELAISIAPLIENLATDFTEANKGASKFASIGEGIATSFATVGDVIQELKIGFYKVQEVILKFIASIASAIQGLTDTVVALLNKIPYVETTAGQGSRMFAEELRTQAGISAGKANKLLIAKTPSERLAASIAERKLRQTEADQVKPIKGPNIQQLSIADQAGSFIGKLLAQGSGMAAAATQRGISSAMQLAGGAGAAAAKPKAVNRAIDATTAEGYRALRANKGQSPQKKLVELTLKQIAEDKKQNVSLGKLVDLIGKGVGDLISIPAS